MVLKLIQEKGRMCGRFSASTVLCATAPARTVPSANPSTSSIQHPCPCCLPSADTVSVVGVQADGQAVAASNTLPMTTPAEA